MERRTFLNQAAVTSGLAAMIPLMLKSVDAKADMTCESAMVNYPGFGGKLRVQIIWSNEDEADGVAACSIYEADPGVIIPKHEHPAGEFVYIISGSLTIDTTFPDGTNTVFQFKKGDSIWFPPKTLHNFETTATGTKILIFEPEPIVLVK